MGVLGSDSANRIEPVDTVTKVYPTSVSLKTEFAILISIKHVQLTVHHVERECAVVLGVNGSVGGTLLGGYQDDTIGTAGTIDSGSRTILKDIETLDVIRVQIGHISSRDAVNDDKGTKSR